MQALRVLAGVDPTIGGPALSAVTSSIAAQAAGVETTVAFATHVAAAAAPEVLRAGGVVARGFPTSRVLGSRGRRWGVSVPLAKWLLRHSSSYDVVHAHGAWTFSAVVALAAARIAGARAVLSPHESLTEFDISTSGPVGRASKRVLRRLFASSFDMIVFSSELEARDSGGAKRMIVLPHPLSGAEPLVRPTHSSDVFSVGFLGRLDPKKNVDVLFRAVARLPDDVHVCVAGTGILEEKLHALAASVGIGDRVHWLGFVQGETKRRFLASIDVLVLPSAYECFGVAAAEAMQVGVPVIVSETTGIAELVRDRGGGLVVRPDVMELADAIAGIASDPQRRIALGDRAREVAARELSVETHGRRLLAAYCDLLRPTASGSDVAAAPQ